MMPKHYAELLKMTQNTQMYQYMREKAGEIWGKYSNMTRWKSQVELGELNKGEKIHQ